MLPLDAPVAVSKSDLIRSELPHPVEMSDTATRKAAKKLVRFTEGSSARFQFACCELPILEAREICGYYAIERAGPMVTTR